MAWQGPSNENPVWCAADGSAAGVPTAQSINCTQKDPSAGGAQVAALEIPSLAGSHAVTSDATMAIVPAASLHYVKFTDQEALGKYLVAQYHIRPPNELTSCETCHR